MIVGQNIAISRDNEARAQTLTGLRGIEFKAFRELIAEEVAKQFWDIFLSLTLGIGHTTGDGADLHHRRGLLLN